MRAVSICSLVFVALMGAPAGVAAQSVPSDPEADTPSGVVYELPVDRARKDAAPRRGASRRRDGDQADSTGGDSAGGGSSGGGSTGSTGVAGVDDIAIRSENNFGTSSRVPGADSGNASRGRSAGTNGGGEAGSGGVEGGSGGGAAESLGELAPSSATSPNEGPSDGVVFLLLGALLVVGATIGVVAGRRAARDQRA